MSEHRMIFLIFTLRIEKHIEMRNPVRSGQDWGTKKTQLIPGLSSLDVGVCCAFLFTVYVVRASIAA